MISSLNGDGSAIHATPSDTVQAAWFPRGTNRASTSPIKLACYETMLRYDTLIGVIVVKDILYIMSF